MAEQPQVGVSIMGFGTHLAETRDMLSTSRLAKAPRDCQVLTEKADSGWVSLVAWHYAERVKESPCLRDPLR